MFNSSEYFIFIFYRVAKFCFYKPVKKKVPVALSPGSVFAFGTQPENGLGASLSLERVGHMNERCPTRKGHSAQKQKVPLHFCQQTQFHLQSFLAFVITRLLL